MMSVRIANYCAYLHDWGWKIIGKYGQKVTLEQARETYIKKGWTVL